MLLPILLVSAALLLAWVGAFFLELPLWIPLLLTVLALAGVGAWLAITRLRARKKSNDIERALTSHAAIAPDTMRPDMAAEVQAMSAEFLRALAALKSSKLGGGGRAALYALPWYAIIGPPGSGKSTALRSSGLAFPYLPSQSRGSVKGVGGTRNCDWWLTNEAVLLDTAGRWTTQEDSEEWLAFLDLLRKHRGRAPLNGILVAVSVDDLLGGGDETRAHLASKVRERVDEVMTRLGITLPVYVLVTKCDLVPGFVETFGDLPRSERGRLWGFTMPFRDLGLELADVVHARMAEIVAALERRALDRVTEERRREARPRIAEFPGQLALLDDPLRHFLVELFQPNVYRESPVLRGVYFTSGTQEGRPIDRLLGQLADAAGISGLTLPEPVLEPKSYFLTKVFFDVLFPDAKLVAPTARSAQRAHWAQIGLGLGLASIAGLATIGAAAAWRANRSLVDSTAELLATTPRAAAADPVDPALLEPLRERAEELRVHAAEGPPITMRLGLYSGAPLREPVLRTYAGAMREGVVIPLARRETMALTAWGARFEGDLDAEPSADEHRRFYASLERHLRLSAPRDPSEPPPTEADDARLADTIATLWSETSAAARGVEHDDLARHSRLYVSLAAERPELALARDERAVRLSRIGLARLATSRVALAEIITATEGRGYDLSLARMIGSTGAALTATENVRGAFTRRAWDELVRERIEEAGARRAGAGWVLGPLSGDAEMRRRALRDDLRTQYFTAYIEEWQRFLRSVRVKRARDESEALGLLEDLTRGDPPALGRLLRGVDHNVSIADPPPPSDDDDATESGLLAALEQRVRSRGGRAGAVASDAVGSLAAGETAAAVESSPASVVRRAFEGIVAFAVAPPVEGGTPPPVALDVYQEQLAFLRDALTTYRDDPSSGSELMGRLQSARTRVASLVSEQPVGARPLFETLLWPPIDAAATTSSRALAGSTGRSWCSSVALPFHASLGGRYPFSAAGHDAAIADFAAFYRPGSGTVWSFYDEALSSQVERDGARFVFATRLGRDAGTIYRSTLPLFLERSQAITSAFFAAGNTEPRLDLDVRVHPVANASSVRFAVGGTVVDYRNGPETWTRVVWPGPQPDAGASLEVLGRDGLSERIRQDGEWGLFRLLERAARVSGGGASARLFVVTWRLPGHALDVAIDVRMSTSASPFFAADDRRSRMLGPLRAVGTEAPRSIAAGSGDCATSR